jgi:ribonuclease P protein subunit RPR2
VRRKKDAHKARDISMQRVQRLFELATEAYSRAPQRADRYVQIARKICPRTGTRMPRHIKRQICGKCGRYLPPGATRVRLRKGILTVTCLRCGEQMRYPYYSNEAQKAS